MKHITEVIEEILTALEDQMEQNENSQDKRRSC